MKDQKESSLQRSLLNFLAKFFGVNKVLTATKFLKKWASNESGRLRTIFYDLKRSLLSQGDLLELGTMLTLNRKVEPLLKERPKAVPTRVRLKAVQTSQNPIILSHEWSAYLQTSHQLKRWILLMYLKTLQVWAFPLHSSLPWQQCRSSLQQRSNRLVYRPCSQVCVPYLAIIICRYYWLLNHIGNAGRDCIGNAKTGSGKTIAFALPILQALSRDPYGIFALVLTPTRFDVLSALVGIDSKSASTHRELAFQIADQFSVLGHPLNVRTSTIIGGMDMMNQALELKERPHVVVATPGRLVDLLKSTNGEMDLSRVKFLVR